MAKRKREATHDANGYPLSPVNVSQTCWLYGDATGLTVVQEDRDHNGKHITTVQHVVPWDAIEKAKGRNINR